MNVIINNSNYTIELVSEEEMNKEADNEDTLGLTIFKEQRILLLGDQANIIKTLIHELIHAWLYEYGHNAQDKQFNQEDVCEIVASAYRFIYNTIQDFTECKELL